MRDEPFIAIDYVVIAISDRSCAHGARVSASIRFGLSKGSGFFAAQDRIEIALLLLWCKRKKNRSYLRPKNTRPARRQRHSACKLLRDHCDRQETEVLPSEVGGHLQQPKPKFARLGLELFSNVRFEIRSIHGVHFDWDQFPIDKSPDSVLQNSNLLRQLKIHPHATFWCVATSRTVAEARALHHEAY